MSTVNNGTQTITFDYENLCTGDDFNKLLTGAIKPGLYGTYAGITISSGNIISIPTFNMFIQSGTGHLLHITTAVAFTKTIVTVSASDYLYATFTYSETVENYLDFNVRAVGSTAVTNEIILGTINSTGAGTAITSVSLTGITYGLFDNTFKRIVPDDANFNIAIGANTLTVNTTGACNVAIGSAAFCVNTTGSENIGIGKATLNVNTFGNCNIAVGVCSLYCNTTGSYNIAIGSCALLNNTIGIYNTAVGVAALYCNTTGIYNTAVGVNALYCNTTGKCNIAVGVNALFNNTIGKCNIAVGVDALFNNTTGIFNTAVGASALCCNTTGSYNTAVGVNALVDNVTGSCNTTVGVNALSNVTDGHERIGIGYNALSTTDHGAVIGNANTAFIGGQAGWTTISDCRTKECLGTYEAGLNFINCLNPVIYYKKPLSDWEDSLRSKYPQDMVGNTNDKHPAHLDKNNPNRPKSIGF